MAHRRLELREVPTVLPGLTLSAGCLVAIVWSLLSWSNYRAVLNGRLFHTSTSSFIADGVLTVLFLAIGMELSSERESGLLRDLRHAVAPLSGALGGMAGTAALTLIAGFALSSSVLTRAWGVPMATDVAFVVGALALAGPRIPRELRTFLLTLAIADDVGSLAALGIIGTSHAHLTSLVGAALLTCASWLSRRRLPLMPLLLLVPLWLSLSQAGTEPALAGVITGACLSPSLASPHLERLVQWGSSLLALPLFALSACGLNWHALQGNAPSVEPMVIIILVRLLGKALGIYAAVSLARALGAPLSPAFTRRILLGAGLLCAMGFTVPLLFARVIFGLNESAIAPITAALFAATILGGGAGIWVLRRHR